MTLVPTNSRSIERKIKRIIPSPIKRMILKVICNSFTGYVLKITGISRTVLGGYYDFSLVDSVTAAKIFIGVWEAAEMRFARRFVADEKIVELGSSVGATLGLLRRRPNAEYVAVEASPRNFAILKALTQNLPSPHRITLLHRAICYTGEATVPFEERTYEGGSIGESGVLVPTIRLSDIVSEYVGDSPYTLISDIEGAEADVFLKDASALKNCQRIICELEDTVSASAQEQIAAIYDMGFVVREHYGNVWAFERHPS